MKAGGFAVLRHKDFAYYLSARFIATVAIQMQSVAIGWQVYQMTGDVFDLGLIGLAQFAPFFVLILWAGHVADRVNRRSILLACYGAQLLCGILLLAFTLSGMREVWPVFVVLVIFGSARAFSMPAAQAILINMVPSEAFASAVALASTSFHVAVIAGPAVGGVLYLFGPQVVYGLVVAMLCLSFVLMTRTKRGPAITNREPATLHSLFEGLRFVRRKPVILGAISLDLFAVLFGGATALLPAIAHDLLHTGPEGLGLMRAAPAVGAAACSIALAFWPITRQVGRWMFGGVAVFGVGTVLLGWTASLWVALAALFVMGAGDMVSVYIRHLLVQNETPDAIRGRVSAVNAVFIGASNELGEFESGLTAGWFGLVPAVLFGGVATLLVTGIWAKHFPVLWTMDRFPEQVRDHKVS